MPLATVSASPSPFAWSTRIGMTFAPGATPSMPFPLFASAATMPVTCVPWPFSSCGVSSFGSWMKSRPCTSRPDRSSCEASTPVSMTATTAPEPVLVECAASAWIMSRPHCCGRSGSAAEAVAGTARQRSRARRHASEVRMASVSPTGPGASPLSGADALVLDELQYVVCAAAERRGGLGGLVRADEIERLPRVVGERDKVLEAAETPRLIAQNGVQRGLAAVGVTAEQHHRAAAADAVCVLGRVLEQLLRRAGTSGCEHDAGHRDRDEPVLADRVGEVLRDP